MPEEIAKALKEIEDFKDLISGIITDLTVARDTMDNTLNIFKDPIKLITADGEELEQKIKDNNSKALIYFMFAANKMQALGSMNKGEEGEENERSE